jgi:hypothetical protein
MDLLSWVRKELIERLLKDFKSGSQAYQKIEKKLIERGEKVMIDHIALLDIPGANSGISVLTQILELIGFVKRGSDRLPEKQNNYAWFAEPGIEKKDFNEALPQIVISDFSIQDLTFPVRSLVAKYAEVAQAAPIASIRALVNRCSLGDEVGGRLLVNTIFEFLKNRTYPMPTKKDFEVIRHENELLAWTMIFSKQVNHVAIAGHAFKTLASIVELNDFAVSQCDLNLNNQGGSSVKGGVEKGIAQSATLPERTVIALEDGPVILPATYIEFAWRYPQIKSINRPLLWGDYFTGFVTENASQVIQSMYQSRLPKMK